MSCLALAAALSFAAAIPGDFVWVDRVEIVEGGYRVTSADDFARLWTLSLDEYLFRHDQTVDVGEDPPVANPPVAKRTRGGYWRPLYALGLTLDWWLHGNAAWRWHLGNIVCHVGVVLLLYALGKCFFPAWTSFFAALLFAVHPLGVHSVAWISGRKDLQCALFGVAAVLCFLQVRTSRRPLVWIATSCLATIAAVGCKELGLCVPIFLTALVVVASATRTPLAGESLSTDVPQPPWRSAVIAQLIMLIGAFVYRGLVLGGMGLGAAYPADGLASNVATVARLAWHYVGRVLWPWQPQISDRWRVSDGIDGQAALAMVGLLAVVIAAFYLLVWQKRTTARPQPLAVPAGTIRDAGGATGLWIPLLWYVVWMLPASGMLPLRHVRAERYLYPASWGLLLLVCAAASALLHEQSRLAKRLAATLVIVVALAWMIHTATECRVWQDDKTLFATAVNRDPDYLEGRVALAEIALGEEDYVESLRHAEIAQRLAEERFVKGRSVSKRQSTGYWSPLIAKTNHGLALYHLGRHAEACQQFTAALSLRPHSAATMYHLGLVATAEADFEKAIAWFEASLRAQPNDFLTQSNLAFALLQRGQLERCRALLEPLVDSHPDNALNLRNLASAHMALQDYAPAAVRFAQLVELEDATALDHAKLAWCGAKAGVPADQVQSQLQTALRLGERDDIVKRLAQMIQRELQARRQKE